MFKLIPVQHKGAKIYAKPYGTSDLKTLDCPISNFFFLNVITHFDMILSRLPNIVQKYICIPDRAVGPTFGNFLDSDF